MAKWADGFPQNHYRKQFEVAHAVLEAVADAFGSELASAESGSAELPLRPVFGEVVEGCSQHPAGNSQRLSWCSPFCNIVGARSISEA